MCGITFISSTNTTFNQETIMTIEYMYYCNIRGMKKKCEIHTGSLEESCLVVILLADCIIKQ